ncbi:hypothetical protein QH639_14790 [Lysinibacillus sp. 1 U-2021]|uniref:hypothetical protein n=1 Tax=Lysinibacillus sp. 1 U-2021 TaxID=3039426 RepID=UPI002480837F|nr:hypothetical protein [Lysinibacillus sp. 1 U-2021]WGT37112.1 hypothetical protein QH639_14790 [Lysinibacillus sp. 1 U-2021]
MGKLAEKFDAVQYKDLIDNVNWNELKKVSNSIFYFDVNDNRLFELHDFNREDVLTCDSFIQNFSSENTIITSIAHYKIIERILVTEDNLILIVEPYSYNSHNNPL